MMVCAPAFPIALATPFFFCFAFILIELQLLTHITGYQGIYLVHRVDIILKPADAPHSALWRFLPLKTYP